jgi:DNA repair protein RadC
MEVFSMALQKRASKVVLCHNHPDGDLKPTPEDRDLTDRLIQVGRIINLPVLDHLVISERSYLSFDDLGLMQELAQSIKYVPSYELVVRVRAEMEALMERRIAEAHKNATYAAKEAEKIDIAKALKASGMAVERVAKFTGLSVEVVARL